MAIQMRRGNYTDFDPSKLLPGEWAVSQDNKKLYMCFTAGNVVEMGSIVSGYGYIRYSENADGSNFVTTPTADTIYIGFYMGSSITPPTEKEDYTWSEYRGPRGPIGVGISSITKTGTSGSTDTYTVTYTDGNTDTFDVVNGTGNNFYWSTVMNSTTSTPQTYPTSGITNALVGDMCINTSSWNVYECTTQGGPSVAEWLYKGNIKGRDGAGTGDMAKSDYDTNSDGIVNSADTLNGLTASITELNYVGGVTSAIQTQLNGKAPSSHSHVVADISDFPLIPTVTVSDVGTASSTAIAYQKINVSVGTSSTDYTVSGSVYMEITDSTTNNTYTFSNAAITANSAIDVWSSVWGESPSEAPTVTAGSCVVKFADSEVRTVRIYIR